MNLPVQVLDSDGNVMANSRISFISPQVDNTTQTVLVKDRIANNNDALRQSQFIRARIVWGTHQNPEVPILPYRGWLLQVALSTVLLIGAGLLTRSLHNLEDQHFGFATQGRLIVQIDPALARYRPEKLDGLYQQLEQGLAELPGVLSASLSGYSPLSGDNWSEYVYIEGHPPDLQGVAPSWDRVGPHYFETIGSRLLRGRVIDERDTPAAPLVAVINQAFARRFFPKEDPIGQHFGMAYASHSGDYEIVGIVEDAKPSAAAATKAPAARSGWRISP